MNLEIDGTPYEFPSIGSFDLDEDRIFYKATGMHVEDVWLGIQDDGDLSFSTLVQNEGFLPAMAHIAYRREHPEETADAIFRVVGRQKRLEMLASLASSVADDQEADAAPLEDGTNSPDGSSPRSSSEKPSTQPSKDGSSGSISEKSSGPPDAAQETIGTGESDASSTSDHLRRVV